jgi:hypothetical protein
MIQNFGRKPEGKRPLGKPNCRLENNIRIHLQEIGWRDVDRMLRIGTCGGLL